MVTILKALGLFVFGALAVFFGFWILAAAIAIIVLVVAYGLAMQLCGVPIRFTRTLPGGRKEVIAVYRYFRRVA